MRREGSRKTEVGGDWERMEGKLRKMGYYEGNQPIIAHLRYSKQRGLVASAENLTSINLSHLFNSHFFASVNINNEAPQSIRGIGRINKLYM